MKLNDEKLLVAMLIPLIAAAAFYVYMALKHPCVKTEEVLTTCGRATYCSRVDLAGNCASWVFDPGYPCIQSTCIERRR